MKKAYLLLLLAIASFGNKSAAQGCAQPEMRARMIAEHPEILKFEEDYEKQIQQSLKKIDYSKFARKTSGSSSDSFWYEIPVVVHVIHNYSQEYLADNTIFECLKQWNIVYAKQNPDTIDVIQTFKKYIGNAHIRLHLATIDPNGNPTKGITRTRSYLTYFGDEQAKFDDWSPSSYLNLWFINKMGPTHTLAAAYAHLPADAVGLPFYDGVICLYSYINTDNTINHEVGHCLNLMHPWGSTNEPAVACGDDGVVDTPPTQGHNITGCRYDLPTSDKRSIYDSSCAVNYFKIYLDIHGNDSLVNYPDTVNAQNIMDYTYCSKMFTKGQVERMHATLNSDVAGRNNLWDPSNLNRTGAIAPIPDLKPIPEFSAFPYATVGVTDGTNYMDRVNYFTFPGNNVKFINETWNDTVSKIVWNFSNGAANASVTSTNPVAGSTTVANSFTLPGWVSLAMTATGNHSGDTTVTWPHAVFVADDVATPGRGYFQEFSGADTAKWPMFNYYNNNLHWQFARVGYDDTNSVEYVGFDDRSTFLIGNPLGDFDDLFSVPFDLSSTVFGSGPCSMNFYYSAASRSAMGLDINDQLEIAYSTNKSASWTVLNTMTKNTLENMGASAFSYVPFNQSDWALFSLNLPAAARTPYTVFRFRYKPSIKVGYDGTLKTGSISSGNNFYMDRLTFSPWPAGIDNIKMGNIDMVVLPNPTSGDAYVVIKDAAYASAQISVTDITGKVVYTTTEQLSGNEARVLIPHASLSVSGMYLVHVVTGNQSRTQKLIVE